MKRMFIWLFLSLPGLLSAQNATEIVRKADEKMRGETSHAEMLIRTVRPSWTREMEVKTWMKGTSYAMILIKSPARDKGTSFLKKKKEVWNWLPALERTIKLPPSMMSQSWMGTDFTNDDLVKESSAVEDYQHTIIGDTVIDSRACYVIQFIPKPEATVVWGKLIVCIDKKDFIELHTRFYDEEGALLNTMKAYDVRLMDGRTIPTRLEMIPADKKGQKTEIIYRSIYFNRPIDDHFFSVEQMKQQN
ncbi:MAG: outer membrane lipoprotein-sorting protein [Bacteroidota bacterium]|nr:outer membrane lipoprotein-sorting protein [Bacteroidota bacterium]